MVIPFEYDNLDNITVGKKYISNMLDSYEFHNLGLRDYLSDGFNEGLVAVRKGDKCGYINKSGEVVIPFKYQAASCFIEGLAAVKQDGNYGYIDKTGKMVLMLSEEHYDGKTAFSIKESAKLTKKEGSGAYLSGHMIRLGPFKQNLAPVQIGVHFCFYDRENCRMLLPQEAEEKYKNIIASEKPAAPGLTKKQSLLTGKWGFVDDKGKKIVPFKYAGVKDFCEGFAWVQKGNKWGILEISS